VADLPSSAESSFHISSVLSFERSAGHLGRFRGGIKLKRDVRIVEFR
jgi:hypothetical protein